MKKITILVIIITLFLSINIQAQSWQNNVNHNGYSCSQQTTSNIIIYAAKGVEGYQQALFIKIKIPYNWGNTGTGCVKYFKENLANGTTEVQSSFFHYKNGWLYFVEYLGEWCTNNDKRGNYPCNNYTLTLYEKNDHGKNAGNKTVVNLYFNNLNTANMPMNKTSFETYW